MKISKLLIGTAAFVGAAVMVNSAYAGGLSPSLAKLSAEYTRSPQAITRMASPRRALTYANAFGPHVNSSGEVQVYIHYKFGQRPADAALGMLGANHIRAALGMIQAWVPISHLQRLANMTGVTRVGLPAYAVVRGQGGLQPQPRTDTCSAVATGLNINNQGIAAENIQALLDQGVKGSGVKVGIISDGADCVSSSQQAGYLPSNVWVDSSLPGSGDEGTAMMEEVHAAAPDAELGFCGPNTTVDFVTCYQDFATWGANIISDDLGFPNSFFFNDPMGTAFTQGIQNFASNNPYISLVTAAGNDRQDYYQADYAPSSATSPIGLTPTGYTPETGGTTGRTYQSVMDIGGAPYEAVSVLNVPAGFSTYFLLTWNDPLNGPYDDLDLYLIDNSGNILDASTYDQTSDTSYPPSSASWNPPEEFVQYTDTSGGPQTVKLIVMCYVCNQTSNLLVKLTGLMDGAGTFATIANGGVYGQAAMAEEISAAAAHVLNTSGTSATLEGFSQTGPYIGGDWKNGTTSVPKPDITGIDGVTVSGAGGFSSPFFGTSAASPNVASVLALLRSGFTVNYTAAQWKTWIMNNANMSRLGSPPPSSSEAGAGLVDAQASAAAFDAPITATITGPAGDPLSVNPNTNVQFTADCNYSGTETLNYTWTFGGNSGIPNQSKLTPDPIQYANGGVYTVQFTCADNYQTKISQKTVDVQAAAVAEDLTLSTDKNVSVPGTMTGTGVGGEQISYNVTTPPAHGTLTLQSNGAFLYVPTKDYTGADSFKYQIDNGVQVSNTATVSITVKGSNSGGGGSSGGGGGGAMGFGALAGLMALAGLLALRRRG